MFRTPAALIGLASAAFLAGSFAPNAFTMASLAQSGGSLRQAVLAQQVVSATKTDRAAAPVPADQQRSVSVIELVGITQATVILRDRHGEILYRSDPGTGTTTFSKNTELPVVTLKEEMQGPAVQHPVTRQEGNESPGQDQGKKRRNPIGCIGDVSPLVQSSAHRTPSLCLALLGQSLS